MNLEQQKQIFRDAIKRAMPIPHNELGKALDFADKFIELGNDFYNLSPKTQKLIIETFLGITLTSPFQFNQY